MDKPANLTPLKSPTFPPVGEPQARFLRACRRLPVDATPVWFMRQAGRYMPEYRAIRARHTLLEIVERPQLAAEVTLQPVEAHRVDAAILFADILLPVVPMGLSLEFVKGKGPVIREPVRSAAAVDALREPRTESDLGHVLEAIRLVRQALPESVPLIGFSGAPFTVAAYMIEGGASRNFIHAKTLMYSQPQAWHALMGKLAAALGEYLQAQAQAGAQALQVFDSWVGALSPADYRRYARPYTEMVLAAAAGTGVPVIHFGTGTATLLEDMASAGGDVVGLDWRVPLERGWARLGPDKAVQGNLDPVSLFAPLPELRGRVQDVLERAAGRPGHIFNLGHGILPETPVANVRAVVDMVHEMSAREPVV